MASPIRSARTGMGAVPYHGGTTFRVWAPHARSVAVAGEFNGWSESATPLASEGNGYWSGDIGGARDGQQYRFVLGVNGGEPLWRIDPYSKHVTNSVGNSIVCDPAFPWEANGFQMPRWNDLVVYEIHAGTFAGLVPRHPGNLDAARARLADVAALGVNAIELMPVAEFATDCSWGYNPALPFAVEEAYGGPHALKSFIQEAHHLGIAVLLDVVYNHVGPQDDDLWRFDGWSENGAGGIYLYQDWRSYTPWGNTRFDYGRGEVRWYLRDNVLTWLEEFRADGLRFDATSYIRNVHGRDGDPGADLPDGFSLLRWMNEEVRARQPWKIMIAEDLQCDESITRALDQGGAGFGSQWDGGFIAIVRSVLGTSRDEDRDMNALAHAITGPPWRGATRRVIYTESHDEVAQANRKMRFPEQITPGDPRSWWARKRSTLAAALVLTSPGIPMLFQGQELIAGGSFDVAAGLDWAALAQGQGGMRLLYRDLVRLRRNLAAGTRGLQGAGLAVYHVNEPDKVLAFHRWQGGGPGDDVVVIANCANRSYASYRVGLPRGGRWRVRFNGDARVYAADFGDAPSFDLDARPEGYDGEPFSGALALGPYSAVILSQDQ